MSIKDEKGLVKLAPVLVTVFAVGVLAFLMITSTASFKGIFNSLFTRPQSQAASSPSIYFGAWMDGPTVYGTPASAPWDATTWNTFESHAGKKAAIVHFGFGCWNCYDFNHVKPAMDSIRARGAIPMLSWSSYGVSNVDVTSGTYDPFITTWAQQAKAWGYPFLLRFDTEMNGHWENYGPNNSYNNTPQSFIAMWRHMHDIFEAQGATNVTWAWIPNEEAPSVIANPNDVTNIANWYPGDAYVDWTGFDGYNWGSLLGNVWQSWDQVALNTYNHILTFAPNKPMIIGETASSETGTPSGMSKALWINDFLTKLPTKYPMIKGFIWFNWNVPITGRSADWPIETSSAAQQAFATGIANPIYATNTFGSLPLLTKVMPLAAAVPPTSSPTPTSTPTPMPTPTRTPMPTPTRTPTPAPAQQTPPPSSGGISLFNTVTPSFFATDPSNVELGFKFRTSVPGTISAVRFYKGPNNTGTHTGSLWNSSGTRLATATFTGETSIGWQQVNFTSPVTISANTTYVASYRAPTGRYAQMAPGFGSAVTNGPLTALANGTDGANGVFSFSGFPNQTWNQSNYYVDVVFNPQSTGTSATLTPVVDTYIASNNPNTIFGSSTSLAAMANGTVTKRAFLRFDLSAYAGRTLNSATLRLTSSGTSDAPAPGVTVNVRHVTNNVWSEKYMTWNNNISSSSIEGIIGSFSNPNQINTAYSIPLNLTTVQSRVGNLISVDVEVPFWDDFIFNSKEASTGLPQLILNFR